VIDLVAVTDAIRRRAQSDLERFLGQAVAHWQTTEAIENIDEAIGYLRSMRASLVDARDRSRPASCPCPACRRT